MEGSLSFNSSIQECKILYPWLKINACLLFTVQCNVQVQKLPEFSGTGRCRVQPFSQSKGHKNTLVSKPTSPTIEDPHALGFTSLRRGDDNLSISCSCWVETQTTPEPNPRHNSSAKCCYRRQSSLLTLGGLLPSSLIVYDFDCSGLVPGHIKSSAHIVDCE